MQTGDILVTPLRRKGKVIGQAHSWVLQDRDELCVVIVWKDGSITSYIEPLPPFEDTDEV
jgi:hypothetical protein